MNRKYDQRPMEWRNRYPVADWNFYHEMKKINPAAAENYWAAVQRWAPRKNVSEKDFERPKSPLSLSQRLELASAMKSEFKSEPRFGLLTMSVFAKRSGYVKKQLEKVSPGEWDRIKSEFHKMASSFNNKGGKAG